MKEDKDGQEETQLAQVDERPQGQSQEPETQPEMTGVSISAYEAQIAERDGRIAELEAQVAEAAKTAEATEQLKSQIEELRKQGESDRLDFELQLVGCRNVKAARAVLDEHGGDVSALKAAVRTARLTDSHSTQKSRNHREKMLGSVNPPTSLLTTGESGSCLVFSIA